MCDFWLIYLNHWATDLRFCTSSWTIPQTCASVARPGRAPRGGPRSIFLLRRRLVGTRFQGHTGFQITI